MPVTLKLGKKVDGFCKWTRKVTIYNPDNSAQNGLALVVVRRRGRRVKIPYKPKGENIGYHWWGDVYDDGHCLWSGRVSKSLGVRGILRTAEIIT